MRSGALALGHRFGGNFSDAGLDQKNSGFDAIPSKDGKGLLVIVLPAVIEGDGKPVRRKRPVLAEILDQFRSGVENSSLPLEKSYLPGKARRRRIRPPQPRVGGERVNLVIQQNGNR